MHAASTNSETQAGIQLMPALFFDKHAMGLFPR